MSSKSNPFEYYKNDGYKCFDKYYLLELIFYDGIKKEEEDVYERLAFAIKDNNYIQIKEVADIFLEVGFMRWGNHLIRVSDGMKRQYLRKANIRRV